MSNKKNISAIYPLSPMQQGMLFHSLYAPESGVYFEQMSMDLTGDINVAAFEAAWQKVVDRYSILRTFFVWENRQIPLQIVLKQVLIPWQNLDWRELSSIEQEQQLKQLLLSQRKKGFDFKQAPLMNCTIIRLGDENYKFIWNHHHILMDGWCLSIIFKEVLSFYEAQLQGVSCQLPTPRPYSDYIDWLNSQNKSTAIEFWQQYLQGFTAPTPLVVDKTISQSQHHSRDYDKIACVCSADCSHKLATIAQEHHLTLSTIVQAAWALLLSRYSDESDVVFGVTVSGRPPNLPGVENMVGLFINTLPLRVKVPKSSNLISWLQEIQQSIVELQQYSYTPLVDIQAICELGGGISLFESIVVFENYPVDSSLLNQEYSLLVSDIDDFERTNYPLSIAVVAGSQLSLSINYDTTRFDKDTIERMAAHLKNLFEAIAQNPVANVGTFNLLSESERHQLLVEWNDTATDYPSNKCIHQLFEQQVEENPNDLAVVFGEQQLTYQQLNQRANQLAHHLQSLGIKPEVLVGICVERSIEMVVGLLGILKAGGAYVPLDPNYPQERLSYMLADSGVGVLVTQSSLLESLPQNNARVVCLDRDKPEGHSRRHRDQIEQYSQDNLDVGVNSDDLAYVIYTSGSTGKPKGVAIEHHSVCNLAQAQTNIFDVTATSNVLQFASFSFDASVWEIFMAFTRGATLILGTPSQLMPGDDLKQILHDYSITHVTLPPSALTVLPTEELPQLANIIVAGEACPLELASKWSVGRRFFNAYGPTESTVCATATQINPSSEKITIGRPIANTQIYILDSHLQPVPIGVPGELYIGGHGLASCYLNQPELTSEKFIPSPFDKSKLYKTGDLARYLPDGNIEFLGRIDNQVKVRGFRIELAEIEAVLATHPQVNQAVVIATGENTGNKRLVAYVVINSEIKTQQLREYLKAQLPDYMVPNAFVILDSLPLTPNGKIDRKALQTTDTDAEIERNTEYVAPRTQSEEIIANIFAQVLNLENIGIYDNFFILGGHSLLATQLISRVRSAFSIEIPLGELFSSPTVAQLDQTITQLRNTNNGLTLPPIQPRTETKQLPLSWAQERLWFLNQLQGKSATYNMPAAIRVSGNLDINALQQAFFKILQRHEVLRTSFQTENGTPIQVIDPEATVNIIGVDLQQLETTKRENLVIEQAHLEATTPFDLENAPLIRCRLLHVSAQEYVLLVTIHHIVSDGWSMGVFIQELSTLYQAFIGGEASPLEKLPIQYADFAVWQRQYLSGQVLETQLDYWKQHLSGAPDLLQLPTDFPRPAVQTYQGSTRRFSLSTDLKTKLQTLSRESGTTLFMTLYAAFSTLLYRYSGQSDILIGSPIANRNRSEIEGLIGFFVNTLVLRTRFEDNPSFKKLLAQVRETTLKAYENQDVAFEQVVEALQPQRSLSHSPLFQVMFVLQNAPMADVELPGVTLSPIELESTIAKFDLTLSITETDQGIVGEWEYNTDLFNDSTIERMIQHFQNLLQGIVEKPEQNVSSFNLISKEERHQLLVEWNDTTTDYPKDKCIHQLFEEQVEKTPDAVALVFESESLTYQQLNQRANQLANHLQTLGVVPEVLVGICVERNLEMVIGLLGILKAGGAYVPLDPNYPQERLSYMLSDSGVGVLITHNSLLESLPQHNTRVICLDSERDEIEQYSQENLDVGVGENNLAYVIYTSGSTGKPKGVAIEHQSPVALSHWAKQTFSASQLSGVLATTSICFDLSVFELFVSLCLGGKVIVADNALDIANHQHSTEITLINTVPSVITELLRIGAIPAQVMTVNLAGEPIQNPIVQKLYEHQNIQYVYNLYGPSEDTTYSTFALLAKGTAEQPSIGRPISNTQTYILDSHLQPVPVGVPGELYIGGDGLARGYLNRPQLTSEKFIQNPFDNSKSQRLYKTGDLARYLSDGNIEFLGRIDNQVKVRGFRIELAEIEAVLATHPQVNQAVVIATGENTGNKRLVAYVVINSEIKTQQLREYLKAQLPDYMVPNAFVILDSLPLTPNGKIDRKALQTTDTDAEIERNTEYVAPRTEVEQILTHIWEELLPVGKVGIHDNFFEIGGDSILSIQVISRAKNAGIQITAKQIFQHQTIAEVATVANTIVSSNCFQGIVTGVAPLTPIQHLFFEEQTEELHHYNQSVLLQIPNNIKAELLEKAVEKLIEHHDALRLRFTEVASEYKQTNQGLENKVPLTVIDLSEYPTKEQPQAIEKIATEYQASLNISTGPIIQVVMFNLGDKVDGRLLIIIHHLAVDGVSWRILLTDLESIYQQLINEKPLKLPAKTTAFIDWATKLNNYAQSDLIKQELDYWLNQPWLKTTSLPLDYPLNKQQNTVGSTVNISVKLNSESTSILLGSINENYNTQINDILLSALSIALVEWTGNSKVLIDLEGHGREEIFDDVDLSSTVGWFTSLFPVLLQVPEDNHIASVIKSIKEELRAIPNRGIGFGILRYLSNPEITEKIKPIPTPEISFNYLGQFDQIQSETGWKFGTESTGNDQSLKQNREHLLDINALVVSGELEITWTYSSNIHSHNTVEKLAENYLKAIRSIIEHCQLESNRGYTPSDFPLAQLNQLEIDELLTPSAQISAIYPLSPMQQGMLFHSIYTPESGVYFEQMSMDLTGDINVAAFEAAWQKIVDRYSILRTFFVWENRQTPLQIVLKQVLLPWQNLDWREFDSLELEQQLKQLLFSQRKQGFDFNQAPLMKCTVIRLGDDNYKFIWSHHHILMDGWCLSIIFKEVLSFYEAQLQSVNCQLPTPRPYSDYIAWLNSQDKEAAIEFWQQSLQDFTAPTPLVVDKTISQSQQNSADYDEIACVCSADCSHKLATIVQEHHLTLSTIVQAAWALLLSRYSDEEDVVFGVTVSGRPPIAGVENMVGLFINTLPLRVKVPKSNNLISWLQEIQQSMVELQQYVYTPLFDIQAICEVGGGISLFESIVVFENYPVDSGLLNEEYSLLVSNIEGFERTNYPLTVVAVPGDELSVKISYDTARFDKDTIERMAAHLKNLFEAIAQNPVANVGTFNVISESERHQLLVEWNNTATDYQSDKCIHQLFEEQVEKTPDAIALVFESEELTYQQLNQRANQLAHHLQTLGVVPEVLVGICVERSIEMVVGLLGILKAGGAYVPLDPNYPQERLSYMLSDSGVGVLITQSSLLEFLPEHNARVVCLDSDWGVIEQHSQSNFDAGVSEDNLAYVIYTSGSTGKPKGVLVEHQALVNHMSWMQSCFPLQKNDKVIQKTPFSFDASVWEFYAPLFVGAILVIAKPGGHKNSNYLVDEISRLKITTIQIVPSLLRMLLETPGIEKCQSLKRVFCGGEILPVEVVEDFNKKLNAQLNNIYGPSEATIDTTVFKCEEKFYQSTIPIGRPISNVQTYILDSHLKPVPVGVPGELYIGGDGLARGYLNRPQLTSEKFIQNPFDKLQRLYKTGDLARYLPDGNIEYLGRIDNQVKIRGFRIELGEIEAVLATHPQVNQAVVIALEENTGNKRLVAYVVANSEIKTQQLREYLKAQLPDYMVPNAFVILDSLPLTPNGKIDRKALQTTDTDAEIERDTEYVAPRTQSEEIIANIFAQVLNLENIGIHDNFFTLGGHSLLAFHLMSEIQKRFQKKLPLATLFQNPTIEQLALFLVSHSETELWSTLVPIQRNGSLPPLFHVPGAGGNVLNIQYLKKYLGNNQPLYGLQAQGLDGETEPLESIEEIAQHHIKAIQTVQSTGPYFLSGYSFGGHVAFEMANQLQRMGESVAYVGILDTLAPINSINHQDYYSNWDNAKWISDMAEDIEEAVVKNLVLDYQTLASLSAEQQLNYFKEQLEMVGFLPPQTDIKVIRGFVQVYKTQCQIKYEPQNTYSAPITLFRAREIDSEKQNSSTLFQEPALGWNQFSELEVEVHIVPGNHISMVREPHVKVLAEKMQQSLQKAQTLQKTHGKTTN